MNPHCLGQTVQFDYFAGYRGRGNSEWRGDERGRGGRGRGRTRGRWQVWPVLIVT